MRSRYYDKQEDSCTCIRMYICICACVPTVGSHPDPPFRTQAQILSAARETGTSCRSLITRVSSNCPQGKGDDSVEFTPPLGGKSTSSD